MATEMSDIDMRDLINHVNMFGSGAVVQKRGRKWWIDFRGFGFPNSFTTKTEAMERVGAWVCALARKRRGIA